MVTHCLYVCLWVVAHEFAMKRDKKEVAYCQIDTQMSEQREIWYEKRLLQKQMENSETTIYEGPIPLSRLLGNARALPFVFRNNVSSFSQWNTKTI